MPASSRLLGPVLFATTMWAVAPLWGADLAAIEKTVGKQPAYHDKPRYCLLVFGAEAKTKVWIVEDGRTLYVDRNANGDLTDDGPPLPLRNSRTASYEYLLDEIRPAAGPVQTKFRLARWNYGEKEDSYGLSVHVHNDKGSTEPASAGLASGSAKTSLQIQDEGIKMYAGWFGTFWADAPANASILHFGGSLEPRLLRNKEFIVDAGVDRLSVCLLTPGRGEAGPTRLGESVISCSPPMRVRIEWPVAAGSRALVTTHELSEHCCYWEYYDSKFQVPQDQGIVEGTAKVTIELPGGESPLPLRTNKIDVRIRLTAPAEPPVK